MREKYEQGRAVSKNEKKNVHNSTLYIYVENNKDLIMFCSSTGLHRHELLKLHGTDLIKTGKGTYQIHVKQGKGGQERFVDVIGSEHDIKTVVRMMEIANDGVVFQHVHSCMDVHYYCSVYACRAYKSVERDLSTLQSKDNIVIMTRQDAYMTVMQCYMILVN